MPNAPASVSGVALVASKLAQSGAPLTGTETAYATSAFMSISFTPEYVEGDEVEEKAADGSVCVYYKLPDVLKRVTFSLQICSPDPELSEILAGGVLLEEGGEAIGYAAPETGAEATPNGVALEVWSRAVQDGRQHPTLPFWRWVFPSTQMRFAGERVLENGMLANTFEGWGVGNAQYGAGALGTWAFPTDRAFQYAQVATAPVGINDYIPVAS
jgi:hypothetical protein